MRSKFHIPVKLKTAVYILSVLICVFSTFDYANSLSLAYGITDRFSQIQKEYPNGSKFTDDYRGAAQCFGFAGYVFHGLYGCDMPNSYYEETWYQLDGLQNLFLVGQLTQNDINEKSVKHLLSQGEPGDVIQYGTSRYPHTMLFLQETSGGITVYDCNYDRQCTVMTRQVSFQGLASEIGTSSPKCGLTLYRANPS